MIGTLSNSQGVMLNLVGLDPYGHWSFKPAAPAHACQALECNSRRQRMAIWFTLIGIRNSKMEIPNYFNFTQEPYHVR